MRETTQHGPVSAEFVPCWVCIRRLCTRSENRIDLIVLNKSFALILFNIWECSYDKIRLQYHLMCQNVKWFLLIKPNCIQNQSTFKCFFLHIWLLLEYKVISYDKTRLRRPVSLDVNVEMFSSAQKDYAIIRYYWCNIYYWSL